MRIKPLFLLFFLCSYSTVFAQVALDTIVAQKGDGIFSILRKAGIHPVKYYLDFLELNKDGIEGASKLVIGRKYVLPYATDSFKNMGTVIHVDKNKETPLFDTQLAGMAQRDSTLKNTVYHVLFPTEATAGENSKTTNQFILTLAKELMERGARVYVLQQNNGVFMKDTLASGVKSVIQVFGQVTNIINKKYLKHNGNYQRVLMIRDANRNKKGLSITMYHYIKSKEGQRFAAAFREEFKNNAVVSVKEEQGVSPFTDGPSAYLAKNVLPPLTIMEINGESNAIPIKAKKSFVPKLVAKAILQDYANATDGE